MIINTRNWITILAAILIMAGLAVSRKHPLIKLNNANWQDMVSNHDLLLVLFHSSDNAHSNGIREELEHYQKSLDFQNSRLNIAELDCYDFEPIKRNMGVEFSQIPFVSLIVDKKLYTLKKKLPSLAEIKTFIRNTYSGLYLQRAQNLAQLQDILERKELSIIYYGQPSHAHFKETLDWSMSRIDLAPQFVICLEKAAADHFGLAYNQVNLFRRHDRVIKHFNRKHYHKRSLEEWLFIHSEEHIGRLDQKGYARLVSRGNPGLVLFVQDSAQEQAMVTQAKFELMAQEVNEHLLTLVCNLQVDPQCRKLMDEVQIEKADLPTAKLIHLPEGEGSDFVLRFSTAGNELSYEALQILVGKYQTDDLIHPDVISEEAVFSQDKPYEVLVGKSIGNRIQHKFRREKDLLILFHAGPSDPLSARVNTSYKALLALSRTSELLLQYKSQVDLAVYDTVKNSRSGLGLVGKRVPLVRLFRRGDESYYADLELKSEPKEILHFLVDRATDEVHLSSGLEAAFQDL